MHRIYRRDFREEDLERIRIREEDSGRDLNAFKNVLSFSYFVGDQIVCIVGVVKINDRTCEVFIVFDECAGKYARDIIEYSRGFLDFLNNHFVRMQAIVRTDWPRSRRFVERLGFVHEGVLRKFGPDETDYCMYARVK